MRVVALDTASRVSAWVVVCGGDGEPTERREVAAGRLDRSLAAVLAELVAEPPDAVVVLTGPGSYRGVRAGMAAALGLSSALGVPLHGAGNLEAVAWAATVGRGEVIAAVADAGRGGVYTAQFAWSAAGPVQVGDVQRVEAGAVSARRVVAAAVVPGLDAELVDPAAALAAAVPRALSRPPLAAAGLTAIHAVVPASRPAGEGGAAAPRL